MSNAHEATKTFDSDTPMAILGVPGRLTHRTAKIGTPVHTWCNQRWISEERSIKGYSPTSKMRVEMRFDDECGNGHNTFAITAEVYRITRGGRKEWEAGGCLHEDIVEVFPELEPLIKWHLCSTDGPMHYIANAVYLASDRDHNGYRAGEPCNFENGVRFNGVPITHRLSASVYAFLRELKERGDELVLESIHHPREPETFGANYAPMGFTDKWHNAPWKDVTIATEFCEAFNTCDVEFVSIPTSYSKGKARDLDAARRAAIWPEATDEQLCADPEQLKAVLAERLPALLEEFRADMERIGFYWTPEGR